MPPKTSAKTVESNLANSDTVEIEYLGVTRVFIQQKISGAGLNCLWRSMAASYYGSQNRWTELHRRARDLYAAATSNAAVNLGSPLQIARRELYENIATMASDFLPGLADGKWGDMDHVQVIADVLDIEIIAYMFDVNENGNLRWGVTVRGNHQPPNRQVHIVNYQRLLHWQVLMPTDIDAEDEDKINDLDWQLFIDPIHMRPTVLGDVGRLARLPLGHARYNDHILTAKDQGHVADDRCPDKAEQLRKAAVEIRTKEAKAAASQEKLAHEVAAIVAAVARKEAEEAAAAKQNEAREAEAAVARERETREAEAAALKEKKAREAKAAARKDKEAKSKATAAAAKEKKDNKTQATEAEKEKKIVTEKIKAEAREKNKVEAIKKHQEAEAAEGKKRVQAAKERDDRAKAAENRKAKAEEKKKKIEAKEKKEKAKGIGKKKDEAAKSKQKTSVTAAKKKTEAVDKILAKVVKEIATKRKKQENKKKPVKKSSKKKATLAAVKPVPGEPAGRLKRKRGVEATEQGVLKKKK